MSDSQKEAWTLDDLWVLAAECAEDGLTSADEAIEWAAARIAKLEALAEAARRVLDDARYSPAFRADFVDGNRIRDLLNALEALDE